MRNWKLITALLAAVLVAVGSAPDAGAATAKSPHGKHRPPKAMSAAKRLAALRGEAEALARRVAALKAGEPAPAPAPAGTPASPAPIQQSIEAASGPAGGDLVGTYPAPKLAPHSVGAAAIRPDAVTTEQFAPGTLIAQDFAPRSIGSADIADHSILAAQMAPFSFGATQLDETFRWPSEIRGPNFSMTLAPGQHGRARVLCPFGTRLISGGFVWRNLDGRGTEIMNSSPAPGLEAASGWEVVAKVEPGGDENTITPVALCLE